MSRSVFMRPDVWTPPSGPRMPDWPFTINQDHSYSDRLEFAWVFVDGLGGVDLIGLNKLSSVDNSDSSITFPGSIDTGGVVVDFSGSAGDDRIDLGAVAVGNPLTLRATPFSFTTAYTNRANTTTHPRVFDKSDGGNSANGWAYYHRGGAGNEVWFQGDGANWEWDEAEHGITLPAPSTWVTVNGITTTSNELFVNGVSKGGSSTTDTMLFSTVTTNAAIGNWNHTTGRQWDGEIYFIDLHQGRILTDAEAWQRFEPSTRVDVYASVRKTFIPKASAAAVVAIPVVNRHLGMVDPYHGLVRKDW